MKTIKELSVEHGIDRSTLLKAAQREYIPGRKSGDTWIIDDESKKFSAWLYTHRHRRHTRSTLPASPS